MLTHLVFLRFAAEAGGQTAYENMKALQTMLEALPSVIPELRSLNCGIDRSKTLVSFDFGLSTTFASPEELEIYRVHPAHQKVFAFIKEVTTERAVVDFEGN